MPKPTISLVIPVRNEAGNIVPLVSEIQQAMEGANLSWELFIVDDGSTDASWDEINRLTHDPRINGIKLDHAQGKTAALAAGFARCQGQAYAMLDGDGQDDPAEIPKMFIMLQPHESSTTPAADLVNGWKTPRLDPWHKTFPSRVFNKLVGWMTGLHLHDHNCGLKVMRSDVAHQLTLIDDMHRFIPVMASSRGFRVIEVPIRHRPRVRGTSKYGVGRFFRGFLDLLRVAIIVRTGSHFHRPHENDPQTNRFWMYAILAAIVLGSVIGRLGAVSSIDKIALEKRLIADAITKATNSGVEFDEDVLRQRIVESKRLMRPFLSANDRSRWLTIRSLVENGSFEIDQLISEPGWDTIDAVAHPDASGNLHLYSSKPPILAVLAAGPYWLLNRLTGWTLGDHPFEMGRMLMVLFGLVPLGLLIFFTAGIVDRLGHTDWGRLWSVALIAAGTFLTTFAIVLTNHLPAAVCAAASLWILLRIHLDNARSWSMFLCAGLTAALTAAFELPALSWLVIVLLMLFLVDQRKTVFVALPAAAGIAALFFFTNWLAHDTLVPPYGHRGFGEAIAIDPPGATWNPNNWYDYSWPRSDGRIVSSYWRNPGGIDKGEQSIAAYTFHVLIGHHGIFSLTPAWLLVIPGLLYLRSPQHDTSSTEARIFKRRIALAITVVSVAVICFYLSRPQIDRNYGGMTSGFRWAFWLAPLWMAAVVPAADRLSKSHWGRSCALILLFFSVLSAAFPTWNPWTLPWLHQWLIHIGFAPVL